MKWLCTGIVFLIYIIAYSRAQLDPTEFFKGSLSRPKLEIVHPDNGQVLNGGVLDIKIKILGYELPSHFDDSSICIGLSDKSTEVGEQCFDRTTDLDFHVSGLSPGETYSLRVLFRERGKTIAMSVRSFRVAGIVGVLDEPVTIETALQLAVKHQINGLHLEAEQIYRNILSENPSHPEALHLLGVVFIQKGNCGMLPFHMSTHSSLWHGILDCRGSLASGPIYRAGAPLKQHNGRLPQQPWRVLSRFG
jgi:hypothetical protein